MVICAAAGVYVATQLGDRQAVLALARPVSVGQILNVEDLRQVRLPTDSGLDLVSASASSTVVGSTVAYSAPAGTLISRGLLGSAQLPKPGKAIAAVGLKPGQFPPAMSAGTRVLVLVSPPATAGSSSSAAGSPEVLSAVITDVQARQSEQVTVLSLEMAESDVRKLAGLSMTQVSVVAVSGVQ